MEVTANKEWLKRLNIVSGKFLMPAMAVFFILYSTVVNLWLADRVATLQNILAMIIIIIFMCNLISKPKQIQSWIKRNLLVFFYFAVRLISLWRSGFDYSVIRTIFFEVFFLIGITEITVQTVKTGTIYLKMFMMLEFIFSFASLALYYLSMFMGEGFRDFLWTFTKLKTYGNALLFVNPNTAGIMVGFAVVISIVCYGKKIFNDRLLIIFGLYNLVAMMLFGCRSADIGLLVVIMIFFVSKIFPKIKCKVIVTSMLVIMVGMLIPVYGVIITQETPNCFNLTEVEQNINSVSTGRYVIWKESYILQKDAPWFGKGSLKAEQQARQQIVRDPVMLLNNDVDPNLHWDFIEAAELGPHNGYIGMISCTGILGLLLFLAILIQRIWKSASLKRGNWYLMLIFFFVVNCFESLFILNRFFICFYMFLLLAIDFNDDGGEIKELSL